MSEGVAAEEEDEFDDEDDDDGGFEEEGAALVELVDHEAVEVFGGVDFLGNEVLVVGDADLGGGEAVEARGEHVAEEFDGVVGVLGEFHDLEQDGVEVGGGAGEAPAEEDSGALFERVVDGVELAGEEVVVVAELEELGVGVLEELDGGLRAGGGVVEEGGVPADDGEVGGVVGDAGLEDLVALAFGELEVLAADDLGDAGAVVGDELRGGGGAGDLAEVEDEVVLGEPVGVGFVERGAGALETLADDEGGVSGEVDVPDPAGGEGDEALPVGGEGELEDDGEDAVVVVLDLGAEALAAVEDERFDGFDDGRALVADVAGSGVFERRLRDGGGAEDMAELVEANLFADVELEKDEDGAGERAGGGRRGWRDLGGGRLHPVKDGTGFTRVGCDR